MSIPPAPRGLRNGKRKAVLEALAAGNTRRDACRAVGINPVTLYDWMHKDQTLSNAVEMAEAASTAELVRRIRKAGEDPKHWTANAWLLERHPRTRDDWAQREQVTVLLRRALGELSAMSDEQLLAVVEQVALPVGDAEPVLDAEVVDLTDVSPDEG